MTTSKPGGGPSRSRRIAVVGLSILACVSVLSACDSDEGSAKPTTTTKAAPLPTVEKPMQVDLTLTGNKPYLSMALKGTAGTCRFPNTGLPPSYIISGFDFPDLGPGGAFKVYGRTPFPSGGYIPSNVVSFVKGAGLVSPTDGTGVTIQPDQQVVTLDTTMTGGPGGSYDTNMEDPQNTLSVHVTGTMRCV